MTNKQKELTDKHGTPDEFEKAVWMCYEQLFVDYDEAIAAIRAYREEWNAAGRE